MTDLTECSRSYKDGVEDAAIDGEAFVVTQDGIPFSMWLTKSAAIKIRDAYRRQAPNARWDIANVVFRSLHRPAPSPSVPGEDADEQDMAALGHSTMAAIEAVTSQEGPYKDWTPAEDPAEIITDLYEDLLQANEAIASFRASVPGEREKLAEKIEDAKPGWLPIAGHVVTITLTLNERDQLLAHLRAPAPKEE